MRSFAEKPWAVAALLAVLVALTQTGSFIHETISWDETTFLYLASQLLDGGLPYVESFDNKPPLIFFLLAAVMGVFGESLVTVRLFGDLCILVTALLTVAIARRFMTPLPAVMAGVSYVAMMSISDAQYTGSELPATLFVMLAVWVLLRGDAEPLSAFWAGIAISLAVLTRSNLAYVAIAIGLFLAVRSVLPGPRPARMAGVGLYVLGGLIPLGLILTVYGLAGALDLFFLSAVTVPLSYASGHASMKQALGGHAIMWMEHISSRYPLLFGAFSLSLLGGGLVVLSRLRPAAMMREETGESLLVITVFVAVVLSILGSGAVNTYYWLQAMPFAAILAGVFLDWLWTARRLGWMALAVTGLILGGALWTPLPDLTRLIADRDVIEEEWIALNAAQAIEPHLGEDDRIWAAEYHLVNWYLDKPPIAWVAAHPDNITRPSVMEPLVAAGVVEADILARIMSDPPAFVVISPAPRAYEYLPQPAFDDWLDGHYGRFFEQGNIVVWRRLGHGGWRP